MGKKYLGARRWIKMPGGAHFQPSEWVKLILILAVAKYFADLHQRELSWPDFMKAGAIVLVSHADGAARSPTWDQPDLPADRDHRPVSGRGTLQAGSDCH